MIPVAMAAVAVGSALYGGYKANKAGDAAKKASKYTAKLKRQETAEQGRRMVRSQSRKLGEAQAATYASGIKMTGSNRAYINDMQTEQARELQWLLKSGESEAYAIEKGAQVQRSTARTQATTQTIAGVASGVNSWWGATR